MYFIMVQKKMARCVRIQQITLLMQLVQKSVNWSVQYIINVHITNKVMLDMR